MFCFGANDLGQLGTGSTIGSPFPPPHPVLSGCSALATNLLRVCALVPSLGGVTCWGGTRARVCCCCWCRVDSDPHGHLVHAAACVATYGFSSGYDTCQDDGKYKRADSDGDLFFVIPQQMCSGLCCMLCGRILVGM